MAFLFVLICLGIGFGLQSLSPFLLKSERLKENVQTNLSLGLVAFLLVGYLGKRALLFLVSWKYSERFGFMNVLGFPGFARLITGVLALDLTAFLWHIANHRIKFLWRFHIVHHTDWVFDPSTALRFHPGEILISLVVRSLVIVALGISVESLAIFESLYLFCNVLVHSNVSVPEEFRKVIHPFLITPALHIVHHTRDIEEQNSNFGTIFSWWDRLHGSLKDTDPKTPVKLGIVEFPKRLTLKELLYLPFRRTL